MVAIREIGGLTRVDHQGLGGTSQRHGAGEVPQVPIEVIRAAALQFSRDFNARPPFSWRGFGEVVILPTGEHLAKMRQDHNLRVLSTIGHLKGVRDMELGESASVVGWFNPDDGRLLAVYDQICAPFEHSIPLMIDVARTETSYVIFNLNLGDLRKVAPQYEREWVGYLNMPLPMTTGARSITQSEIDIQWALNDATLVGLHGLPQVTLMREGGVFSVNAFVDKDRGLVQLTQIMDSPSEFLEEPSLSRAVLRLTIRNHDLVGRWTDLAELQDMDSAYMRWFDRGPIRITRPNGVPGRVELLPQSFGVMPRPASITPLRLAAYRRG